MLHAENHPMHMCAVHVLQPPWNEDEVIVLLLPVVVLCVIDGPNLGFQDPQNGGHWPCWNGALRILGSSPLCLSTVP